MKNKLTLLFTIYFFLTSVGILYSKHYCGSKVSGAIWGISISNKKACACSHNTSKHKKSCCKSDVKILKAKTDTSKTQTSYQLQNLKLALTLFIIPTFLKSNCINTKTISCKLIRPPPLKENLLFIQYSSLII